MHILSKNMSWPSENMEPCDTFCVSLSFQALLLHLEPPKALKSWPLPSVAPYRGQIFHSFPEKTLRLLEHWRWLTWPPECDLQNPHKGERKVVLWPLQACCSTATHRFPRHTPRIGTHNNKIEKNYYCFFLNSRYFKTWIFISLLYKRYGDIEKL